jgi:uncharacterized protein YndB with AHSA1/START domain
VATNRAYVDAGRERVWEVLAEPQSYAHWVVGSSRTRRVVGSWPATGSRFEHRQGFGPVGLRDTTEVVESRPPALLVLEVRVRPLLVGRVELRLDPHGEGTWLSMSEHQFGGLVGRVAGSLLEPALLVRNVEAMRRLRRLAERGEKR